MTNFFMEREMTKILIEAAIDKAMTIIREFESCKLRAYKCPAGAWTIGWSQTAGIKEGGYGRRAKRILTWSTASSPTCRLLLGHVRN